MDCPHVLPEQPATFVPLAQTILHRLHTHPGHCALRFRAGGISSAALLDKILRLAERLPEAGIDKGLRVGVCLERGPDTLVVLLALWLQGAVYVPLDPALPRERLLAMCTVAELDVLLTHCSLQHAMSSLPCALLVLEALVFDTPQELPTIRPGAFATLETRDPAYILFTSGSSGSPKGVRISQGNLAALFAGVLPLLDLPPGCRILGCANFSFDIAFFELLAPLLCGGTLVLADQEACASPVRLLDLIAHEHVDIVQATPSHWQLLHALSWPGTLTMAIATGEALPRTTAGAILQHASVLWNLYGPTECTLWACAHRVRNADLHDAAPAIISIGSALPGYTLRLQAMGTPDAEVLPDAGELVIGGPGVGLGYCAAPYATGFGDSAEQAEQRVYASGDLCAYDAEGLLHFRGRRDHQVKHNGYRIELDEIALLLQQHASISQAACVLKPATAAANSQLVACVVFRPGLPNKDKRSLNQYLAAYLPAWMLPQYYCFLDSLPLTPNGKLDRRGLLALTAAVAPVSAQPGSLQARVAQVFCDVLDLASIGPCDSFLDAGGSSMLAATLVLTLNERLGSALTLRQVLQTPPTVSSISHLLQGAAASGERALASISAPH